VAARDPLSSRRPLPAANYGRADMRPRESGPANLADILERVLDKGIVIAGDIQINLLDIELLNIKLRLLVASVDRAREMGINWWESDPQLSGGAKELEKENRELRDRLERLERLLPAAPGGKSDAPGGKRDVEGEATETSHESVETWEHVEKRSKT
jgi:Gas vesicle protein